MNEKTNVKEELEALVNKNDKKAVVLMTYNTVEGFKPGIYGDGRLIVYSWDKKLRSEKCKEAAKDITDKFYKDFNLRRDGNLFEHIFVYAGMNAMDEAISAARMIGHDLKDYENLGKKVTMVGCDCDYNKKARIAHDSYSVSLIQCECGGDVTMGKIAKAILEGKDPKTIKSYGK